MTHHITVLMVVLVAAAGFGVDANAADPPRGSVTRTRRPSPHRCSGPPGVARYARPAYGCQWDGYYVGGGAALGGEPRNVHEGTWGWDYFGNKFRRRVDLNWWHGRAQGGTGAYKTDGPHVIKQIRERRAD